MIKVQLYENAIVVDGHARRNTNGAAECCAAVSAAVQTALAFFDVVGYDLADIAGPYADHGGYMVIFTDKIVGWERIMLIALEKTLEAQENAWPGEIDITRMHDRYGEWYAENEEY